MRRLLVSLALAAAVLALPAAAFAATKPVPVSLAGMLFNNKPNDKMTIKLGGSLRFMWKNGFHNVLTSKAPAGANKVNSGAPTRDAQADHLQAHEEGQVRLLLPAPQGARHGAHPDRQVGRAARRAGRAHQLRPPSVETSSSPSGATAYQMRSLRGSEATIVARGPLVCHVAP